MEQVTFISLSHTHTHSHTLTHTHTHTHTHSHTHTLTHRGKEAFNKYVTIANTGMMMELNKIDLM